jgi:hypothetical protein
MPQISKVLIMLCCLVALPFHAWPQQPDDSRESGQPDNGGGRHHRHGERPSPADLVPLKPEVQPRQRLDAGALLCHTEAALQQHQAAVAARLSGGEAPEPSGCRFVRDMVAVDVMQRDGLARTEVKLHGTSPEVGWTNAMIRDQPQAYGK